MIMGCSTHPLKPISDQLPLAFQQQAQADLVVDNFYKWDFIHVIKPRFAGAQGQMTTLTRESLVEALSSKTIRREMVVVVLAKAQDTNGKTVNQVMDDLEAFFQRLGFRRIVIQLAVSDDVPDGLPILRDRVLCKTVIHKP